MWYILSIDFTFIYGVRMSSEGQNPEVVEKQSVKDLPAFISAYMAKMTVAAAIEARLVAARGWLKYSMILNIVLAFAVIVLMSTNEVETKYFTVDPQGRITEVVPQDQPTLSKTGLRDWAAACVRDSYSFSFINFKNTLGEALDRCFTSDGMSKFKQQLAKSGIVKDIVQADGALVTQIDGTAIVKKEGIVNGTKAYIIEVPVIVEQRYPKAESVTRKWTVIISVLRVDNLQYPSGMAIHVWNMEPRR